MKKTPELRDAAMADLRQALNHALGAAADTYTLIRIDHLVDDEPAGVAYNLANRCMLVLVDDTDRRHTGFDEPLGLYGLFRRNGETVEPRKTEALSVRWFKRCNQEKAQ
jgi:hypothetical protein